MVLSHIERLRAEDRYQPWQLRQAEQALRLYFHNYLPAQSSEAQPEALPAVTVDENGRVNLVDATGAMRDAIRLRHYSPRTERTYLFWIGRFFDYLRKQQQMNERCRVDIQGFKDFLAHLALRKRVASKTQNQAFSALLFLFRHVLHEEPEGLGPGVRAKDGRNLPVVLSQNEVKRLLASIETTMVYTHVVRDLQSAPESPLDSLLKPASTRTLRPALDRATAGIEERPRSDSTPVWAKQHCHPKARDGLRFR